jgi:hypothetical protein
MFMAEQNKPKTMTILGALQKLHADFVNWGTTIANQKQSKYIGTASTDKFLSVDDKGNITTTDKIIPLSKGGTGVSVKTATEAREALGAAKDYWSGTADEFTLLSITEGYEEGKLYFVYENTD